MAQSKTKAGPLRIVFPLVLLFGPALFLIFISTRGCEHKFKELEDYGEIPAYSFTDVNGKKYTNKSFKDIVVLYTTIQPKCPDSCGILVWHLDQLLYQNIRENKKKLKQVRIVSFVTDGNGNPSSDLKDVQEMLENTVEEYDPNIWILANGDARSLWNIKHNGQSLLQKGDKYLGGEAFQELMLLGDKENHLRMVLPGNTEGTIRTMRDHISLLQKQYDKARASKKK